MLTFSYIQYVRYLRYFYDIYILSLQNVSLHVRRASSYGMLPKIILWARRWTSLSCFVCSFVRLVCQHGLAYSRTGRTVCILCGAPSKVYVTVQCPSVRLSVPLQRQKSSLTQPDHRQPGCGNMGYKTALSSKCGQCHVYSQWGRLNIDLFKLSPRRRGALSDTAIRPSVRLSVAAMPRSCPRL